METIDRIVSDLHGIRREKQHELSQVENALQILNGRKGARSKRVLSKDARERIAEAQRQRWAKARRGAKKQPHSVRKAA